MKNEIINLLNKKYKVAAYSDTKIIFSSKNHISFESLEAAIENEGLTESIKNIPLDTITKLNYNEARSDFKITYTNKKGKTKKTSLILRKKEERNTFVSEIASLKKLQKNVTQESRIKPFFAGLFIIASIGGLTYWFRTLVINATHGDHVVVTTRKGRFIAQLLIDGIEAIGPTGVVAIGGAGILYFLFLLIKRLAKPANEVIYSLD